MSTWYEPLRDYGHMYEGLEAALLDSSSTFYRLGEELVEFVKPEAEALEALDLPEPERLCHYTDFAGLKGILSSGRLWFTYTKTLNDSVELQHGQDLIMDFLNNISPKSKEQQIIEAGIKHPHRVFVSCFCESSRVLSMWRNYSSSGGGYCLEFDNRPLLRCRFPPQIDPFPTKMTYAHELSEEAIALINKTLEFGKKGNDHAVVAGYVLSLFPEKFKHPAFREEREWRFKLKNPNIESIDFRSGHSDVKPYVAVSPQSIDGNPGKLPLKKIVFGPTVRNDEVIIEVLSMMLEKYEYPDVEVESSGIPFRL